MGDDAYLLRLANQSLFGDALVALSSALDSSGAQAGVSDTAGATYYVALGRESSLEGRLRVTVNVPSSTSSGRLALASLDVVVTARLRPRALTASVGRADLEKVFDDDIRRAAIEIAADVFATLDTAARKPLEENAGVGSLGSSIDGVEVQVRTRCRRMIGLRNMGEINHRRLHGATVFSSPDRHPRRNKGLVCRGSHDRSGCSQGR